MKSEAKDIHAQIEELMRRVERHEWRIVDLEKRLMSKELLEIDSQKVEEKEYKEPILRRAARTSSLEVAKNGKHARALLISLSIVCVVLGVLIITLR